MKITIFTKNTFRSTSQDEIRKSVTEKTENLLDEMQKEGKIYECRDILPTVERGQKQT